MREIQTKKLQFCKTQKIEINKQVESGRNRWTMKWSSSMSLTHGYWPVDFESEWSVDDDESDFTQPGSK